MPNDLRNIKKLNWQLDRHIDYAVVFAVEVLVQSARVAQSIRAQDSFFLSLARDSLWTLCFLQQGWKTKITKRLSDKTLN
jgi:hypothetical protein